MRATHPKPTNTNRLTAIKLKRGCSALCTSCMKGPPPNRVGLRGLEVCPQSKGVESLKCLSRKPTQYTGNAALTIREVEPCNLSMKESLMKSETRTQSRISNLTQTRSANYIYSPPRHEALRDLLPQILIF